MKFFVVSFAVCAAALSVIAGTNARISQRAADRIVKAELRDLRPSAPATLGPLQEIIAQKWDTLSSSWKNINRTIFFYDQANNPIQQKDLPWTGSGWREDTLRDFYPNAKWDDFDSSRTRKNVDGTGWVDYDWSHSIFNANGYYVTMLKKSNMKLLGVADQYGDTLHDSLLITNIFKGSAIDTQKLQCIRLDVDTTGKLVNNIKFWVHFNLKGYNDVQRIFLWDLRPDTAVYDWLEYGEHRLTYDAVGNEIKFTTVGKSDDGTYVNIRQEVRHYTAFKAVDTLWKQESKDTGFVNTEKTVTAYAPSRKKISETVYAAYDTGWVNDSKTEYQYDAAGALQKVINYDWPVNATAWRYTTQDVYGYTPLSIQKEGIVPRGAVPKLEYAASTAKSVTVRIVLDGPSKASLAIYDLKGNSIKSLLNNAVVSGTTSIVWDKTNNHGAAVRAGSLICRLSTPRGVSTRQLIVTE